MHRCRDAATRSGALGTGATVSIVTASAGEAALTLPARSVCFAVRVCAPSPSAELVIDQLPAPSAATLPSAVVPFVSYSVTAAPASRRCR